MAKIEKRITYQEAEEMIKIIENRLKNIKFGIYGSYIRKEETIGDFDMLVKEEDLEKVKELLKDLPFYDRIEFYSLPKIILLHFLYNNLQNKRSYLKGNLKEKQ